MNQIKDPPNTYNFGLNFNYAVWTPGTVLSLVNVPWNNDYRDIVRFPNKAALNTYIDELEPTGTRIEKMSYVKPNTPVRINEAINKVIRYNYLRASNPLQPIPGGDIKRDYYYFITDVRYLSPNTTELVLQLDLWQTFGYDVRFGTSYVERGHIGIANENAFDNYGRDYLAIPEGFDLGGEYLTVNMRDQQIYGRHQSGSTGDVIVVSTVDLEADAGTVEAPKLVSAQGSDIEAGVSGAEVFVFNISNFKVFMANNRNKPWVTQGVISAKIMPKVNRYDPNFVYGSDTGAPISGYNPYPKITKMFSNWRDDIMSAMPSRYQHLKKFLTYPYMGIEMTCFTGNTIVLKPEAWHSDDAEIMERATYTPPNNRVDFIPRNYNSSGSFNNRNYLNMGESTIINNFPANVRSQLLGTGDDYGDYLDISVGINNFPTIPLVNNGQLGYLAANNATLNYQRESADWSQQRSLAAAQTGYDQATKGLETAEALNHIAVNADQMQTQNTNRTIGAQAVVSAVTGVVAGTAGGAASGGGVGAAAGAASAAIQAGGNLLNTGIQTQANDESFGIRQAAMGRSLAANQDQGGYVRDTNKSLADWSARGDYANEIAGINAKVQDAAMIQPSVSGQFGGESVNFTHGTASLSLRWKFIDNATVKRIGEYWLRYGYKVNLPVNNLPEDMMVMSKFTYWKLTETYLQSSPMPESFKQAIRGIFEKGVTVWARPEYIGNTDFADNTPREGITI